MTLVIMALNNILFRLSLGSFPLLPPPHPSLYSEMHSHKLLCRVFLLWVTNFPILLLHYFPQKLQLSLKLSVSIILKTSLLFTFSVHVFLNILTMNAHGEWKKLISCRFQVFLFNSPSDVSF